MTVAVRVIPCLDVDDGRVVKGVNFRGLRDAGDPVELAAFYDAEGADELTFLDITASSDGRDTMVSVVARTASPRCCPPGRRPPEMCPIRGIPQDPRRGRRARQAVLR